MIGLRYPTEVNLVGDSAATLEALLPKLEQKLDGKWRASIESSVADWWATLEDRAMTSADGINPQRLFWELSPRIPPDAILTSDSGSAANWYARDLKFKRGMMGSLSGGLATMGPGVPYAIAAKFCHGDRPAIALVGDGAMQMNGLNGLITIAKYWRNWRDPRLIVAVLNNGDLNQVTWEQRVLTGDPKYEASQNVPEFAYAAYAELLGFKGIEIRSDDAVADAWDEALRADRPVVIDAHTDPKVPPLPPHIKLEQATAYWRSLLKGDPEGFGTIRATLKEISPLGGS